jgi:hypothetical protein
MDLAPEGFETLWDARDVARYLKASRSWVYPKPLASHVTNESAIRTHILLSDLAPLPLTATSAGSRGAATSRRRWTRTSGGARRTAGSCG